MRDIERIKGRKTRFGVAILSAAALGVATEPSVEAANGNGGKTSLFAAAGRAEASAPSENANGGFWPRLGSNAGSTFNVNGNAWPSASTDGAAAGAQSRVESANFIGYSGSFGGNEPGGATNGRTRLVDWTTSDALPLGAAQSLAAPLSIAPVGGNEGTAKSSVNRENAPSAAIAETTKTSANGENASSAAIGETTKVGEDKEDAKAAAVGESESRSKTPILRDEPTAATRGGGSFGSALVSTFGALAVVLGAFLALVAFLKRTAPNSGGSGGALEIVDSLAVGDKARLLTIRWGNRLILAAKTPEKIASLAEIADVDEASALLAEIERRKSATATGEVGAKAAAIWKRGVDATSVWRTAFGAKGRRQ